MRTFTVHICHSCCCRLLGELVREVANNHADLPFGQGIQAALQARLSKPGALSSAVLLLVPLVWSLFLALTFFTPALLVMTAETRYTRQYLAACGMFKEVC